MNPFLQAGRLHRPLEVDDHVLVVFAVLLEHKQENTVTGFNATDHAGAQKCSLPIILLYLHEPRFTPTAFHAQIVCIPIPCVEDIEHPIRLLLLPLEISGKTDHSRRRPTAVKAPKALPLHEKPGSLTPVTCSAPNVHESQNNRNGGAGRRYPNQELFHANSFPHTSADRIIGARRKGGVMKRLNLPKYKGDQFVTASHVFFDVLADLDDLMGQNVIAGQPEPLTWEQLEEYRAGVVQQTFADLKTQSEEQTA